MSDLIAYIQNEFDAIWNTNNVEAVMARFAEDSVVQPVPPLPGAPAVFRGKEQIRGFVQMLIPNFCIASKDYQQTGDQITWFATISSDSIRQQFGVNSLDAHCEAIVQNGQIKRFAPTFTPETLAQLETRPIRGL